MPFCFLCDVHFWWQVWKTLLKYFWRYTWFSILLLKWNYLWHHHLAHLHNYCRASRASEQQHNQNLRIYRREYDFSNSSLFTRMHEYTAPLFTRVHCAMREQHKDITISLCGFQWERFNSGYVLLWFTCKMMWRRSYSTFTTLALVLNAVCESLYIWIILNI